MTSTSPIVRILVAGFTVLAVLAVWPAGHAESQPSPLVVQGRDALNANKVDEGLALLQKAVELDPQDPFALAWLGAAQTRKAGTASLFDAPGWVKKGFTTLDEAVERFPNVYIVYLSRGVTGARVPDMFKKAPGAVKDLNAVLAMREKSPDAVPQDVLANVYLNLGLAYKKSGQPTEARAAWEKGRTLYPTARETPAIEKELREL